MDFFAHIDEMDAKAQRAYRQEDLILEVSEQIWAALSSKGMVRKDLARKLETSPANVSRLLNGARNMTLRTLSDIAYALDCDVNVYLRDKETSNGWVALPKHESTAVNKLISLQAVSAANDWTPLKMVEN